MPELPISDKEKISNGVNSTTKDLIILNAIPGFGYERLKNLLNHFNTTADILNLKEPDIIRAKRIFNIEKEIETIEKEKIRITTIFDSDYPARLKQIHSPPIVLYIKGEIAEDNENRVAVVGCRRCSQYGENMTRRICSVFAGLNITVVSGMARGIDTVAHKETIANNGKTIAVLGSGLKNIYPAENKRLSEKICENGLLISEFPLDTAPLKENFPRRNRVISGLSKGVVVIEAPKESGALITADFALDEGRDVFAVCGNADAEKSKGCNNLIKQGAKLTESAMDVIEELFPEMIEKIDEGRGTKEDKVKTQVLLNIPDGEKKIYELLSDKPVDVDTLTEALNLKTPQVLSSLLNLELKGFVKQLPGKLYIKT